MALYVRLSAETDGLGLKRQEADCRKLAKRQGWDVELYVDPDNSAYKRRPRPEFERMLRDLDAGVVKGIIAYDLDRLARRPSDLERIIDLYDQRKGLKFGTVQGELDLATADGRTMARVMVAFANKSSSDTSRRVTRKHLELAQRGLPVGGHRPFGYEKDKKTIKPKEAELIRKAAADVIAGIPLNAITRRWNEAGLKTTAGNRWHRNVMKNMLLSPRMAGFRVYQGGIAHDEDGNPVTGMFEPILDMETWEAVCAVLRDPRRSGPHVHSGGRKYLLSGLARCECGRPLRGNANTRWNTFTYSCTTGDGGCGRVAITGPRLDEAIEKLVLDYLKGRKVKSNKSSWLGETELQDTADRIKELMTAFSSGELSSDVVFPAVKRLEDRQAELKSEKSTWLREQAFISQRPANVTDAWPEEVERRRAIIETVLVAVLVKRAAQKGGKFDLSRVSPVWR